MTSDQVKEVFDRVLIWPPDRQEDAAQMLLALEAHEGELYHPDENEWAAIAEGLAQADRGDFASPAEIEALLRPRGASRSHPPFGATTLASAIGNPTSTTPSPDS